MLILHKDLSFSDFLYLFIPLYWSALLRLVKDNVLNLVLLFFFFPLYRLPASNTVKQLPGTTDNKTSGLEFVCRSFCGTESCECCCQGSCLCKRGLGRKKIGKLMFSIMCLSIWTISIDCVNIYFILRTCWSCC